MPSSTAKCPSCQREIERDSVFCRYCGHRLEPLAEDARAVLERTADFSDLNSALDAIEEYLRRWPESPQVLDVHVANQCIRSLLAILSMQGGFKESFQDVSPLADAAAGLPAFLSNGLATTLRVGDPDKRKSASDVVTAFCAASSAPLQALLKEAEQEHQSLLVEGKTQAVVKQVTMEQAYQDAEVHYASFEKGDLEVALRGFTYLKELAPTDAYFRNVVGTILFQQGKPVPALREYLFGLSLDPGDLRLVTNTLRCVCDLGLFPAAVEIARHRQAIGLEVDDPMLSGWCGLARAVTAALAARRAACAPEHFSATATDLLDELEMPERPWLTRPHKPDPSASILHDARVFISYRHAGGLDYAQHLERALKGAFPSMHVFRDQTCLEGGLNFVDQLRNEIDAASVFLALVDRDFAGAEGGRKSRLLDPKDILRREVARALTKEVPIIPVVLEGATMPGKRDLPEDLRDVGELHAIRLSEAGFDREFGLLLEAMTRLVTEKKLESDVASKRLDELMRLSEKDPEAARAALPPALGGLQKYVKSRSVHGEGLPEADVETVGRWTCEATGPAGRMSLRFVTEDAAGWPFSGEAEVETVMFGVSVGRSREEIKGTWMPIYDVEKKLILGLFLDGLKSGQPLQLQIPFHRLLGRDLVGTDAEGITYSSRNVEPRRAGF